MYLLGLRALGHEVFYVEDTGECAYDPVLNTVVTDPSLSTAYIQAALEPFGLGDRWTFVNYDGSYHGRGAAELQRYAADADLFINLSGGSWFWRDEYARIPKKIFIDSDPAYTQLAIAKAEPWYVAFFKRFDHLFTFGSNIGTPASAIPTGAFTWHKTWQPVTLDDWKTAAPAGDHFTTVMTWRIESFADVDGNKDQQFLKFIELPARTTQPFELAINGPQTMLREHGWSTVDAMRVSRTPWAYRDFIHRSRAEFGVAKHTYVESRSGWFSDRTECYLASGRPALVQDTGWTAHLPHGDGLLAFSTPDDAVAAIEHINGNYERHARAALDIAHEYFDARLVLPRLLETACS
jgi:hypothetical protein